MTKQTMIGAGCSGTDLLENAFFTEIELCSGEIFFDAALLANPFEIALDSLFQAYCRCVSSAPNDGSIGCEMPHFSGPKLAIDDRFHRNSQRCRNQFSHSFDCDCSTTSDVHGFTVQAVRGCGEQIGPSDVLHKAEITSLLSI